MFELYICDLMNVCTYDVHCRYVCTYIRICVYVSYACMYVCVNVCMLRINECTRAMYT